MMNKNLIKEICSVWMSALTAVVFITSCGHDETGLNSDRMIRIGLFANIAGESMTATATRAPEVFVDSAFPLNSTVNFGLCFAEYGSYEQLMTETGNMLSEYIRSSGSWAHHFDGEIHHDLSVRENLGFSLYAYYPYQEKDLDGISNFTMESIPFEAGKADYLWAKPVHMTKDNIRDILDEEKNQIECNLEFKHVMSCICLKIKCDHSSSLKLKKITLVDKKTDKNENSYNDEIIYGKGHFDATTGDIDYINATKCNQVEIDNFNSEIKKDIITTVHIVIPPVDGYSDERFEIEMTFDKVEDKARLRLPSAMSSGNLTQFKAGYMYTYNVEFVNNISFISPTVSQQEWKKGDTSTFKL